MSDKLKVAFGLFAVLVSLATAIWQVGAARLWLIWLILPGLVLFVLACWGLSWLITPKGYRELVRQLTPEERRSSFNCRESLASRPGRKPGRGWLCSSSFSGLPPGFISSAAVRCYWPLFPSP